MLNVQGEIQLIQEGSSFMHLLKSGGVAGNTKEEIEGWIKRQEDNLEYVRTEYKKRVDSGQIKSNSYEDKSALEIMGKMELNIAKYKAKLAQL